MSSGRTRRYERRYSATSRFRPTRASARSAKRGARRRLAQPQHHPRARHVRRGIAAPRVRPVDQHRLVARHQDVPRVEVAVAEPVAVGEAVQHLQRELRQVLRQRAAALDPPLQRLLRRGDDARRLHFVELGVHLAADPAHPEHRPGPPADQRQQVRPIDPLHDQPRPSHDRRRAQHGRHAHAPRPRGLHRRRLPLVPLLGAGLPQQPQDRAVLPGEHLRLPALGDFLQLPRLVQRLPPARPLSSRAVAPVL